MEDRTTEACADRFDELSHRIAEAQSAAEFREALDDMEIYLTAQREIAAMIEVFPVDDAIHQHLA